MYLAQYARQLHAMTTIGSAVSFSTRLHCCLAPSHTFSVFEISEASLFHSRFMLGTLTIPRLHSMYPIRFCPADLSIHMPRIICICVSSVDGGVFKWEYLAQKYIRLSEARIQGCSTWQGPSIACRGMSVSVLCETV